MQYFLCFIGVVIVLTALPLKTWFHKFKSFIPKRKTKVETVDIVKVEAEADFAQIVEKWEDFVDMLVDNDMPECAEDMKSLLVKMATEYRSDLNEDDMVMMQQPSEMASGLNHILVKSEENNE